MLVGIRARIRRSPIGLLISVLGSGSSGNVTLVSDGPTHFLVDGGLSCRDVEKRLAALGIAPRSVDAILLSHEHHDHVRGALQFARKHKAALYATDGTFRALGGREHPELEWLRLKAGGSYKLGRFVVEVFPTPHDASEPVCFRIRRGRLAFSQVTDIGHVSPPVEEALDASQVLLVESNHDVEMLRRGPYPESIKQRVAGRHGHLSNEALARYLESRLPDSARHLFLAHLSRTNNHEALALASARGAIRKRGGDAPAIHLTHPDRPTRPLRLSESRAMASDESQGVLAF